MVEITKPAHLVLPVLLLIASVSCNRTAKDSSAVQFVQTEIGLAERAQFADLQRIPASRPVRVDIDRQTVLIPSGQRLDLFFQLPRDGQLHIDQVQLGDDNPYHVLFQRDGEQEVVLDTIHSSLKSPTFDLPAGESPFACVSFAGTGRGDGQGRLLLVAPRIQLSVPAETHVDRTEPEPRQPNIIIYLVDTLRKDHLGVYGYESPVSPNIDEFAAASTVYDQAITQSPWTRPSVASILTGLEPHLHNVNRRVDALPLEVETLAEALGQLGYETAAFITNGNVGTEYQFDQGFDFFSRSKALRYRADQLNERIFSYLGENPEPRNRPLFLYLHAMDPHSPYQPPERFRERFAPGVEDPKFGEIDYLNGFHKRREIPERSVIDSALALYDAEIAFLDEQFGVFLEKLRSFDLYDDTLIMFVADHGEEFWEHGDWSHGQSLHAELLDMPLIVKEPRQQEPQRSNRLTQHVDLYATAMDWAGQAPETFARGHSLRSPREREASVYSKLDMDGRMGIALIQGSWKLIDPRTGNLGMRPKLFDRSSDPEELNDLWATRPIVGGYLLTLLRRHETATALRVSGEQKEASEELERELEALGYIN